MKVEIKHIGARKWKDDIVLHLSSANGLGYEQVTLKKGCPIEVEGERLTQQVQLLTRPKRGRPPVIEVIELGDAVILPSSKKVPKSAPKDEPVDLPKEDVAALLAGDELPSKPAKGSKTKKENK